MKIDTIRASYIHKAYNLLATTVNQKRFCVSEQKMARRYDSSTTTFSPEGRLHQVEYAIEAINVAGTCVGLQSQEGIVLAAERRVVSKLLAPSKSSEKTFTLDDHLVCLVAGLTADANILVQEARVASQRYVRAILTLLTLFLAPVLGHFF